jgi:hypothetical protein
VFYVAVMVPNYVGLLFYVRATGREQWTECAVLTICRSNLNPSCMGRKAAFFTVGI